MFGLEVLAAVSGIVLAISSAYDTFTKWDERHKKRKQGRKNTNDELVLQQSGLQVRIEYDRYFTRLGPAFAKGDSTS